MDKLLSIYPPQKRNTIRFIYSLFSVFIMVIAIPAGVFLVSNGTGFIQLAKDNQENREAQTEFYLENVSDTTADPDDLLINVLVRSDEIETNLYDLKLKFSPEYLSVKEIATDSASFKNNYFVTNWFNKSFDNSAGVISLTGGVKKGIKTEIRKNYLLATIYFKGKQKGQTLVSVEPTSSFYKSSNNEKVEVDPGQLVLNVDKNSASESVVLKLSCQPRPVCLDNRRPCKLPQPAEGWCPKQQPKLNLITPIGGEVYPFNSILPIEWQGENIGDVSVYLLMNGEMLGKIAQVTKGVSKLEWDITKTLLPTFAIADNSFHIQLFATADLGGEVFAESQGPTNILLQADQVRNFRHSESMFVGAGDANKDGIVNLQDISIVLSEFGSTNPTDLGTDLNADGLVSDIDLWLVNKQLTK